MEIIFAIISIILSVSIIVGLVYLVYGSWKKVKDFYFGFLSTISLPFHIFAALMFASLMFITLCTLNNEFWHLDYLTAEGLWEK